MGRRTVRPATLAVSASLVAHLVVLAVLPTQDPPSPGRAAASVVTLDLVSITPPTPRPRPTAAGSPDSPASAAARPLRATRPVSAESAPARPSRQPAPLPGTPASAPPEASEGPRSFTLLPRDEVLGAPVIAQEVSRGRTLHPEDLPSEAELAEETRARVALRVDGFIAGQLATARTEGGLVDPVFAELHHRLDDGLAHAPDFTDLTSGGGLAKTLISSWAAGAARYGATGSPYTAAPSRLAQPEVPSALQREVDRGSEQARRAATLFQVGARLRDFGEGRMGTELYAVVEIRQASTGAVERLQLVDSSGVRTFDEWVLLRAQVAVDALGVLDAGAYPRGLRSTWGFTGRVTYMRELKDARAADDGWYLALATVGGALTGRFDEVRGTADYVDLRHPHYECGVKLLQVYDAR